jgi:hypothetical protein
MAQGPPNIDNAPLDPGGQALGLVNPEDALIGISVEITLLALSKASIIIS